VCGEVCVWEKRCCRCVCILGWQGSGIVCEVWWEGKRVFIKESEKWQQKEGYV